MNSNGTFYVLVDSNLTDFTLPYSTLRIRLRIEYINIRNDFLSVNSNDLSYSKVHKLKRLFRVK